MIRNGGGRIVNLGSQAGAVALPTESVYCMTKAAIAHLTKCLAVEWARHGINVNAVAPTFIKTPGTVKWLQDDAFRTDLLARIPLGRVGEPTDVSAAVVFLASPAAALVNRGDVVDRWRVYGALTRRARARARQSLQKISRVTNTAQRSGGGGVSTVNEQMSPISLSSSVEGPPGLR
jgi:NAD(P)-dependent dehydrogenase (short-subunit alcohol dehydrogenase family)